MPVDGKYRHTLIRLNVAGRTGQDDPHKRLQPDGGHYNIAIPVQGKFRQAIIDACDKCTGSEVWREKYLIKDDD